MYGLLRKSLAAPLPRFEGHSIPPLAPQTTGPPASPTQAGPAPPIRVPPLGPDKIAEYSGLFEKSGAENGVLSGIAAKQIFERARLPNDVLGKIWSLSDTQGRGLLDVTAFVIAMHLLASYKSGVMRGVPNTLPPGLYEAAARKPPTRMGSGSRPSSSHPPAGAIPPHFTGFSSARPQSPIARQQVSTPLSAQSTGDGWVVTPADKARFDQIFSTVDKTGRGYITGEEAVNFFGNARLPEEVLAQIWDLADIRSEGQLNKDEFAVAMYLVRQQRGTKDGRGNLPAVLPPHFVPPGMRKQQVPPPQPTAPAFENAPITKPPSAADDLFGLDAFTATPAAPTAQRQVPQSTGGTDAGPFANPRSPMQPAMTSPAPGPLSTFKPFIPSSSFGQSILPQPTGSPAPAQTRAPPPPPATDDLLGDADPEVSQRLTNETSELANLSNQVSQLSHQMTGIHGTRGQAEQELNRNTQQKREFESRLAQLRSAYEKEVQEVKALQEQLTTSRNDTKRLQQDMAMIEGSHQDLSNQHQQLRNALQADQQENTSLKERIGQLNREVEQLKPQLEKLKSDARQHKGLVAINKKQLSTNEAERDRLRAEHATTQKAIEDAAREAEESKRQLEASQKAIEDAAREAEESKRHLQASQKELEEARNVPVPQVPIKSPLSAALSAPAEGLAEAREVQSSETQSPMGMASPPLNRGLEEARNVPLPGGQTPLGVASPASTSSNPFFRRAPSVTADRALSPPPSSQEQPADNHSAFDSIFGPSFTSSPVAPAPATSFRSESPAQSQEVSTATSTPRIGSPVPSSAPDVAEPRTQITSSSLPFRHPLGRQDSVNSSVKVAPPASRVSHSETPHAMTPTHSSPSPNAQQVDDPFESAAPDEEQDSIQRTLPARDRPRSMESTFGPSTSDMLSHTPGAFPETETPRSETPAQGIKAAAVTMGAGAATLAAGAGLAAAVTGRQEKEEPKGKERETPPQDTNFDDFFGGPVHRRTPSEQASDFDSAFADIGGGPAANDKPKANGQEFPDIQEVEDDEDSSDYSDETPVGFDDDFNAKSVQGGSQAGSNAMGKQPEVASAVPARLQPDRPPFETASSTASSLPGVEQQMSPPSYGESVPAEDPNHFPREYKGLLPERGDPTSPPPTAGGSTNPAVPPTGAPPSYGPEIQPNHHSEANAPAPTKGAPFDFDSAFTGMGSAPVEDDESDDEEDTSFPSTSRTQPDFDATFDSPPQSRSTTAASQEPDSIYASVTSGTGATRSYAPSSNTNNYFGSDNFGTQASSTYNQTPTTSTTQANSSHDWDDLFKGLSSPPQAGGGIDDFGSAPQTSATAAVPPTSNFTSTTHQSSYDATPQRPAQATPPRQAAATTYGPIYGPARASPPTSSSAHAPLASPPPTATQAPATTAPQKPNLNRVLSGDDDPILKRLTSMGWNRDESLDALEKFDYNIDKVSRVHNFHKEDEY